MHAGGTVAYVVEVDGVAVGWVGDGREWRGWRYGGRRWWACYRLSVDTAAQWSTGLDYAARKAAVSALLEKVAGQ
ncbi:hypothetical protein ACWDKQ_05755 [Saccharopolyspora sp. NPDC000995]